MLRNETVFFATFSSLRHRLYPGRQSRRGVDLRDDREWAVCCSRWEAETMMLCVILKWCLKTEKQIIQAILWTLFGSPTITWTLWPPRRTTTTACSPTPNLRPGPWPGLPPPRRASPTWCAASASTAPQATRSWPSPSATPARQTGIKRISFSTSFSIRCVSVD